MKRAFNFSPLGTVTVCASALIAAYYFVYMLFCLLRVEVMYMALFALFVISGVSLPIIFRNKLKKILGRAYRVIHIIFTVLLCVYIVTVIAFWIYIGVDASKTPQTYAETYAAEGGTGEDTAVLVFGCFTKGMTPGPSLKLRLDAAYELLTALPDSVCVVSGSQGKRETAPECESMRAYLIGRGIEAERIIMEGNSHSTSENIRFSKALLDEMGLSDKRIIGVSTAFHLPRIEFIANRYDIPIDTCAAPSPGFSYHYVSMVREYLSYIKMVLFDEAVIITRLP